MDVVCAVCGSGLTITEEKYDTKNILCPLLWIEVAPCCTCMSRETSIACEEQAERLREGAENGGLGR